MNRTDLQHAGAILTVDLDAVAANWRLLRDRLAGGAECGAVVKADGYGLGMGRVARRLWAAGCRTFFVALLDEGIELRALLPEAEIHLLNGLEPGTEALVRDHALVPVLDSLDEIAAWAAFAATQGTPQPADVHVDTAMARLGLTAAEVATLAAEPERLEGIEVRILMSHLACGDTPDDPLNRAQLDAFRRARETLAPLMPGARASLANSPGIFLGPDYHFDLVRPGAALYGVTPDPEQSNPLAQVVRLQGKILQVRDVDTDQTVGYGATYRTARKGRLATVAVGYADGYPRALSNVGVAFLGDERAPVVGRVSMDLVTIDVSGVTPERARAGALVDLIGPRNPVDSLAEAAGTIGYEILTGLGRPRHHRVYVGDEGAER